MTSVGENAFFNCANLLRIEIPESVQAISSSAFNGCTALSDIYFYGNEAQWNALTNAFVADSELKQANIHCDFRSYTVFLDANGGSVKPSSVRKTAGRAYGELPTPTRDGYTFAGWYTDKNSGTQIGSDSRFWSNVNQTLYAHWTSGSYTVTFYPNGGVMSPFSASIKNDNIPSFAPVIEDTGFVWISPYISSRQGYVFSGWHTEKTGGVPLSCGRRGLGSSLKRKTSTRLRSPASS